MEGYTRAWTKSSRYKMQNLKKLRLRGTPMLYGKWYPQLQRKNNANFFDMQGKERKAMTGRGLFQQVKETIKAEGGRPMEEKSDAISLQRKSEAYGVQAKRIGHTIDRTAGIANRTYTAEHRNVLIDQNKSTIQVILSKGVDATDTDEAEMLKMIREAPTDAAAVGATYKRVQDWYRKMQIKTKKLACAACTKSKTEKMQHKVTGIKAMSCAISAAPAKPLMHAR